MALALCFFPSFRNFHPRLNATPERFENLGDRTKYLAHLCRGYNWAGHRRTSLCPPLAGRKGEWAIWLLAPGRGNNIGRVGKKRFGHRNCCNTVTKGSWPISRRIYWPNFLLPRLFSLPLLLFKSNSSNEEDHLSLDQFLVEIEIFPIILLFFSKLLSILALFPSQSTHILRIYIHTFSIPVYIQHYETVPRVRYRG